ncbi:MAG: PH domain-containing protein [Candidatus Nanoarchaeia archaeon]
MNKIITSPKLSRVVIEAFFSLIFISIIIFGVTALILFTTTQFSQFRNFILLGGGILLILTIFSTLKQIIRFKYTTYIITPQHIKYSYSFLAKTIVTIPTTQITDVQSRVGFFLDKLFGVGTLQLFTSGSSGADISLKHISNIDEIYTFINKHSKAKDESEQIQNYSNTESNTTTQRDQSSQQSKNIELEIKPNVKIAMLSSFIGVAIFALFALPIGGLSLIGSIISGATGAIVSLLIIFLILGAIILLSLYFQYKYYSNIVYRFYNSQIEYFDGFLTVQKHTVSYQRITNSSYSQTFIDRVLGVSTIIIETAGSSSNLTIKYINNGEEINNKIQSILQSKGVN